MHGRLLLRSVRLRRVRRRMDGSARDGSERTGTVRRHRPFRRSATQVNGPGLLLVTPPAREADRMAARWKGAAACLGPPVPVAADSAHGRSPKPGTEHTEPPAGATVPPFTPRALITPPLNAVDLRPRPLRAGVVASRAALRGGARTCVAGACGALRRCAGTGSVRPAGSTAVRARGTGTAGDTVEVGGTRAVPTAGG